MSAATLEQARRAHVKLAELLHGTVEILGIGIARLGDGYALRVNLTVAVPAAAIPSDIDGVPVIAEVVGPIRPL